MITRYLSMGLALMTVLIFCPTALAFPSGWGSGTPMETEHDMVTGEYDWVIGSTDNRISVSLDPDAGPWVKVLRGTDGGGFNADDTGYTAPNSFQLIEHLVIAGNLSWRDWHEEIVTPGWDWGPCFFNIPNNPPPGYDVNYTDQDWPNNGGAVDMTFNALAPGTLVTITKTLYWVGDPDVQGNLFFGTVTLREWPTPEPATVTLLAIGGLILIHRRRT